MSMKSFHMHTIAWLCIYICCLHNDSMYRSCNTCCHSMLELPVSLQEAVLGLKTLSPITPIREGRGLVSAVVSRVIPTLWKRADQKKKYRRKQYSGRRRQMQADADRQANSQPCRRDSLTGQ